MKYILCYGDSNTWGNSAFSQGRIPFEKQWVNILQAKLGNNFHVVQEGMPGRIAGDLQSSETWYNGRDVFRSLVVSHSPLDFIIVSLGTNDFQTRYKRTAKQIVHDILWYREEVRRHITDVSMPEVIIVAPVHFYSKPGYFEANDSLWADVTAALKPESGVVFIEDIELSEDGVHFTYNGHEKMARDIALLIK